ncbi:MAG: hypothetical protein F6K31_33860 [Symploca sp. SIO2G7]|nr:hypothetical protein [Symploca sp. SIO2G7]
MRYQREGLTDSIIQSLGAIIIVIGGVSALWEKLYEISPYLPIWLIWFLIFYGLSIAHRFRTVRHYLTLLILVVIVGFLMLGHQIHNGILLRSHERAIERFEQELRSNRWITYEPTTMNPYQNFYGTIDDIKTELHTLSKASFSGIITFSSEGTLAQIPKEADNLQIPGMIMGVINPTDKEELALAIKAKEYVDAYCIGHMFTDYRDYSKHDILKAIKKIRRETNLPVTTTLRTNGYLAYPEITREIDWFFPDIHGNWYEENLDSTQVFEQSKELIDEVGALQKRYPNKPILLKMISFPSSDIEESTVAQQYTFFKSIVEYVESSVKFPERVYASYFSAFDISWKTQDRGWPVGEQFVGFFDQSGSPKQFKNADGQVIDVYQALNWSRTTTSVDNNN